MNERKTTKDFEKMIIESVKKKLSFYAWQSVGGIVEKCELRIKAFRKDYNEFELEVCDGQEESLAKVISGNRILNIYIPELSVAFFSELKSVTEGKRVKLYPPAEYSFFERRKHERVQPTKTCHVIFEHNKIIIKKPIYDLSISGAAIVLPKSDRINVEKGKLFTVFTLAVGIKKVLVKAECVNSITLDRFKHENLPYGGFKLAFRFIGISNDDKAYLTSFVTQEILMQVVDKKAN